MHVCLYVFIQCFNFPTLFLRFQLNWLNDKTCNGLWKHEENYSQIIINFFTRSIQNNGNIVTNLPNYLKSLSSSIFWKFTKANNNKKPTTTHRFLTNKNWIQIKWINSRQANPGLWTGTNGYNHNQKKNEKTKKKPK